MIEATRLLLAVALMSVLLPAGPSQAQLARTFVSSVNGNDANDCGRATPCRTFQGAHDKTLSNGEITVLDPGGYGTVTITKAISIINDGVGEAGMLVSGGSTCITVTAGPNDAVSLRGLTIKGIGFGGGNGLVFGSARSLTIENCVIRNLTNSGEGTGNGILFYARTGSSLAVSNTLLADNDGLGISVGSGTFDPVTATLNRVVVTNNSYGIGVLANGQGPLDVAITDSIASNNSVRGISVENAGGVSATVMVVRSTMARNAVGVAVFGTNATVRLGRSAVTGNAASWSATGGAILRSYGDNNIDGNGDGNPAPMTTATK